ncbi:hypothetical protein [Jatrophihabitans sp.]|uniref:hypothetical protein n=1 Tax=Jatrophihabitans sp. TaxID=1932789 RepID=UPI0030C73A74|nr:hypothetical protein [Jatrophihabitans sp.]
MTSPDPTLAQLLGGAPPASIAALPPADQARLAEIVAAARRKQASDLAASFEASLKHVPFPIRGLVKKTLLG